MSGGKGERTVELPASCSECLFYRADREGECHRHAPNPGEHKEEVPWWPRVWPDDLCGNGALPDDETPAHIDCHACVYWHRLPPGFERIRPQGRSDQWWAEAGLCRRSSPSPSREKLRHPVNWPITHSADGCGEGAAPAPETLTGALTLMAVD